jgi:hypothetical protein
MPTRVRPEGESPGGRALSEVNGSTESA